MIEFAHLRISTHFCQFILRHADNTPLSPGMLLSYGGCGHVPGDCSQVSACHRLAGYRGCNDTHSWEMLQRLKPLLHPADETEAQRAAVGWRRWVWTWGSARSLGPAMPRTLAVRGGLGFISRNASTTEDVAQNRMDPLPCGKSTINTSQDRCHQNASERETGGPFAL